MRRQTAAERPARPRGTRRQARRRRSRGPARRSAPSVGVACYFAPFEAGHTRTAIGLAAIAKVVASRSLSRPVAGPAAVGRRLLIAAAAEMGVVTRSLVYTASLATYAYGIYFFAVHVRGHSRRPQSTFGGEWKYLTILNMWLQIFYYLIALFSELLHICLKPTSSVARRVRSAVDGLHASAAWPFGLFVAIAFWAIYAVDRELVYPQSLDEYIPQWLNHVMHTVHIPLLLADKYVSFHKPPTQRSGIGAMLGLSALYLAWVLYLAIYENVWVYPILELLPWSLKIPGFALTCLLMIAFYKMGLAASKSFWGADAEAHGTRNKAKAKRS